MLTKIDKCDLSQKGLEKKKKEIALAMCIDEEKILICENYKPNQKIPDSRDVQILQFLTKVHKRSLSQSFINFIIESFNTIKLFLLS